MTQTSSAEGRLIRSFGRKRGKKLRPGREALVADLLPRLRVLPPVGGRTLNPVTLFPHAVDDLWLEIGFGGGEHLAAQARTHPRIGFIGGEPFVNGVAALLTTVSAENLTNIRIIDDDIRPLLEALPDASVGRVFILFPDPWPKRRHHNRRLISPATLDLLARVMKDGAELRFASDHMDYVRWTLGMTIQHPAFAWTAECAADWRERPADGFPTRYEAKALGQGSACVYLTFLRVAGARP